MPKSGTATIAEPPSVNGIARPDHGLNIEVATVTPAMAAAWLANGGKNRKLNERRVDRLVAALHRGEWELTGDALKLDFNGSVRDGQHRLQAVVKSGVSIQTLVVRGVGETAFNVMDSGRSRSTGDVLGMHGYANANIAAGAARILMMMERFGQFAPKTREAEQAVTAVTTLAYWDAHPEIANGIHLGDRVRAAGVQGGGSTWAALMTLFLRIDAEATYQYSHFLATGESMDAGHPVLTLRNRLLWRREGHKARAAEDRTQLAAMAIKAWNAFREGRKIQMLYWRGDGAQAEPFPVPA